MSERSKALNDAMTQLDELDAAPKPLHATLAQSMAAIASARALVAIADALETMAGER